ncbi:hypothetical protein HY495_02820 [Candidatus Woesearchaeota archaeon]|nr:hypothetical protein [Candidatus Woesearchaeota archaeon]
MNKTIVDHFSRFPLTPALVERIRAAHQGRNPHFNYQDRAVKIVTDDHRIDSSVSDHLHLLGFEVEAISSINHLRLSQYEQVYRDHADAIFEQIIASLSLPISRTKLLWASSLENQPLAEQLSRGLPLVDLLKEQFDQIISNPDNIFYRALDHYLGDWEFSGSHLVAILHQHNLVAPLLASRSASNPEDRELAYHPLGRRGKLYGLSCPFPEENNHYLVYVNAVPFVADPTVNLAAHCAEILNHELLGHGIMNLADHLEKNFRFCVMATKRCDAEYAALSREEKSIYFCEDCSKDVPAPGL